MSETIGHRLLPLLLEKQRALGVNHRMFSASIGVAEDHWSKIRARGSVTLTIVQRAVQRYPDLALPVANTLAEAPRSDNLPADLAVKSGA